MPRVYQFDRQRSSRLSQNHRNDDQAALAERESSLHNHVRSTMEIDMKVLLQKLAGWFHSSGEENEHISLVIETAEDGARVGMVGWY